MGTARKRRAPGSIAASTAPPGTPGRQATLHPVSRLVAGCQPDSGARGLRLPGSGGAALTRRMRRPSRMRRAMGNAASAERGEGGAKAHHSKLPKLKTSFRQLSSGSCGCGGGRAGGGRRLGRGALAAQEPSGWWHSSGGGRSAAGLTRTPHPTAAARAQVAKPPVAAPPASPKPAGPHAASRPTAASEWAALALWVRRARVPRCAGAAADTPPPHPRSEAPTLPASHLQLRHGCSQRPGRAARQQQPGGPAHQHQRVGQPDRLGRRAAPSAAGRARPGPRAAAVPPQHGGQRAQQRGGGVRRRRHQRRRRQAREHGVHLQRRQRAQQLHAGCGGFI